MSSVDLEIHLRKSKTWLTREKWQRAGGSHTYDFDAVAGGGGESPSAGLLAGVFIRPIGAGDITAHTVHRVIASSCEQASLSQPLHHADMEHTVLDSK